MNIIGGLELKYITNLLVIFPTYMINIPFCSFSVVHFIWQLETKVNVNSKIPKTRLNIPTDSWNFFVYCNRLELLLTNLKDYFCLSNEINNLFGKKIQNYRLLIKQYVIHIKKVLNISHLFSIYSKQIRHN